MDSENRYPVEKFCCAGCRFVYRMIHEHGLQSFYEIKERAVTDTDGGRPARVEGGRYLHFDDPAFVEQYVRGAAEDFSQVEFYLPDMYCAACVWLLEKLPELVKGVRECRVDFGRLKTFVSYDPREVKLSAIASSLDRFGYPPAPAKLKGRDDSGKSAEKQHLLRMGVAGFCAGNIMLLAICLYQGVFTGIEQKFEEYFRWVSMMLALPVMLYSAVPFYRTAIGGLRMGRLHIDLPIVFSIVLAFVLSVFNTMTGRPDVYFDSITALVFLLLAGRWFQRRGMQRASAALELSGSFLPLMAEKKTASGVAEVYSGALVPGDLVLVRKGSVVPADGKVSEGTSTLNNAVLTGESLPVPATSGSLVFAGTSNVEADLIVEVLACGEDSRVGRLLQNLEREAHRPAAIVELADRVGAWFVVVLFILAAGTGVFWLSSGIFVAIDRVLALLVLACPCALGLATPVALSVALARAARSGLLIRGSDTIERIVNLRQIYFDKTGTLTEGVLTVVECDILASSERRIWKVVEELESVSTHPVAASLLKFANSKETPAGDGENLFRETENFQGKGVMGTAHDGSLWRIGSWSWIQEYADGGSAVSVIQKMLRSSLSPVVLAKDQQIVAVFGIGDTPRKDALETIEWFRREGFKMGILSGDDPAIAQAIGRELGFKENEVHGGLSPEDKLSFIRRSGAETQVAMVGDGMNDAAALGAASVGIGVHGGAEICLKKADVFAARAGIEPVQRLFVGARRTMRVIHRNIVFSLIYNAAGATAAILGYIDPLVAAILMPLSSITVISSSLLAKTFEVNPLTRTWK
jgi:P-type Cu2+ transporter